MSKIHYGKVGEYVDIHRLDDKTVVLANTQDDLFGELLEYEKTFYDLLSLSKNIIDLSSYEKVEYKKEVHEKKRTIGPTRRNDVDGTLYGKRFFKEVNDYLTVAVIRTFVEHQSTVDDNMPNRFVDYMQDFLDSGDGKICTYMEFHNILIFTDKNRIMTEDMKNFKQNFIHDRTDKAYEVLTTGVVDIRDYKESWLDISNNTNVIKAAFHIIANGAFSVKDLQRIVKASPNCFPVDYILRILKLKEE